MTNYFSPGEIVKTYGVHNLTVIRWIERTLAGKLDLELVQKGKYWRIVKNPSNEKKIEKLVEESKKFRSGMVHKSIIVDKKFYTLYTQSELISLIDDLETKRETKIKFSYKGDGAKIWQDRYKSNVSPLKHSLNILLDSVEPEMYQFFAGRQINLVDIGPGNGEPIKNFIDASIKKSWLQKYVPIDISDSMNELVTQNVTNWFPGLQIDRHELDIEQTKIQELLASLRWSSPNTQNLILMLGNTLCNLDDRIQTLKNIRSGMDKNDALIVTIGLNSEANQKKLTYVNDPIVYRLQTQPLRLLGVDIDECEPLTVYDPVRQAKVKTLSLDKDYTFEFDVYSSKVKVEMTRGEKITIWKHHLLDLDQFIQELTSVDLQVKIIKTDGDYSNALAVCVAV